MESGISRAQQNKVVRQKALREQLSAQGHVQHVIDIANQLADLSHPLEPADVQRLKAAADIKKGLIAKYLPDLKSLEITGDDENPISHIHKIELVALGKD